MKRIPLHDPLIIFAIASGIYFLVAGIQKLLH
jgi:hypothetical protein